MPYHRIWFTEDQERLRAELGIEQGGLSAWVREKMQEERLRRTSLAGKFEQADELEAEARQLREEAKDIALQNEQALAFVDRAIPQARAILAANPRASVQTSLRRWLLVNPTGQRLRELLPAALDEPAIVSIIERYPDSRPELVRMIHERTNEGG